jgi:hypothetical protein
VKSKHINEVTMKAHFVYPSYYQNKRNKEFNKIKQNPYPKWKTLGQLVNEIGCHHNQHRIIQGQNVKGGGEIC